MKYMWRYVKNWKDYNGQWKMENSFSGNLKNELGKK
jgi:hypothetical protein